MTNIVKSYPRKVQWKITKHKSIPRTNTSIVNYEIELTEGKVLPESFDVELEKLVEKYAKSLI